MALCSMWQWPCDWHPCRLTSLMRCCCCCGCYVFEPEEAILQSDYYMQQPKLQQIRPAHTAALSRSRQYMCMVHICIRHYKMPLCM
jgi:hypothetical protein